MNSSHKAQIIALKDLVLSTSKDQYTAKIDVLPHSTMGAHVRHLLEFFDCFLSGFEKKEVDYQNRKRDLNLEEIPSKAVEKCDEIILAFSKLSLNANDLIIVWSEMDEKPQKLKSTIAREIEYLFHHMVHHLALIGVYLRSQGRDIPENFGVAPSTISFWETSQQ